MINLPQNPNGYFVTTKDPGAKYLVETNPLFNVGSNFVGSDYLASRYGYNPDHVQIRLGDSNYEAFLIRQQLVNQTGNNLLKGYGNEAAQMKRLMDQASAQGKALGLTYGQPPSDEQLSKLTDSIVWMVETEIGGRKVLAPVVYLAQSTRDSIESGAVISGDKISLDLTAMTNTGGTISGGSSVNITSKGDIINTSGTIKGGNVALKSLDGSIKNETLVTGVGVGAVGKQAGIIATGDLSLNAKMDVINLGADVKAGGSASITAGRDITFDTIERRSTTSSSSLETTGVLRSKSTQTTTTTVEQIRSGLTVGGNLSMMAGNDITLAGVEGKVGGSASMNAGNNINLVGRENTTTTKTESTEQGLGVGGGVAGTQHVVEDKFSSRNVGTNLNIGGDASMTAGNTVKLQGSNVNAGGNVVVDAKDIKVLAGRDVDTVNRTETTQTFLKSTDSSSSSGSRSGAGSEGRSDAQSGSGSAQAGASADAGGTGGLALSERNTTTTRTSDSRAVGSGIKSGGSISLNAKDTVTLEGAKVDAKGDVNVTATNVDIKTAKDVKTSEVKSSTDSVGFFAESANQAGAQAGASGSGKAAGAAGGKGGNAELAAKGEAGASADASSKNSLDFYQNKTNETNSLDIKNNGSSLAAGGNLNIKAKNTLNVTGSELSGDKGVDLKAKDMSFNAAEDVSVTTTKTSKTGVGLYADVGVGAKAAAEANGSGKGQGTVPGVPNDPASLANMAANGGSAEGLPSGAPGDKSYGGGAGGGARAAGGVQVRNTSTNSTQGSSTAVTSMIKSGSGSITRTAEGSITDVGTNIDAAGNVNQTATTINSKAASNSTWSSTDTDQHQARIGGFAEAGAGKGVGSQSDLTKEKSAGAGVEASYSGDFKRGSTGSSTAVVSNVKAGGNINSTSKEASTFEGTKLQAKGDVNIDAGSVEFKAAKNTTSATDDGHKVDAKGQVALVGSGSGGEAKYDLNQTGSSSSTAVAGSIQSGGNLNIKSKGDARFEGTDLAAGGDAKVAAGGNLKFDAAKNESTDTTRDLNVAAQGGSSGSGGKNTKSGSADVDYGQQTTTTSKSVAGGIKAGGNLSLSAGGDATLEGTKVQSGGDTSIGAGGSVNLTAARDTTRSEGFNVGASGSGSSSKETKAGKDPEKDKGTTTEKSEKGGALRGGYNLSESSQASTGSVESGGNLRITSGKNVNVEGTDLAAAGKASVKADGDVNFKAAESTSNAIGVSASGSGSASSQKTEPNATGGTTSKPAAGDSGGGSATKPPAGGDKSDDKQQSVSKSSDKKGGEGALTAGATSTAKAGSIRGGGGIDVSAGNDANFEGTKVQSGGDANVSAGRDVKFTTANSSNIAVDASGKGSQSQASSNEKGSTVTGGNVAGAKEIGKLVAERAKEQGIKAVVFDRGGYLYHGRVKALADAAREAGLEF